MTSKPLTLTTLVFACILVVRVSCPGEGDSGVSLPSEVLKMHEADISTICVEEVASNFESALYQFAFADLTVNSNVDFSTYDVFVRRQIDAFSKVKATFVKHSTNVKENTVAFIATWLKWYAFVHISEFYNTYAEGAFADLGTLVASNKVLEPFKVTVSEDTINTLFSHLVKDREKVTPAHTELKAKMLLHYTNLFIAVIQKRVSNAQYDLVITYLSKGLEFFDKKDLYKAFMGFANGTAVYDAAVETPQYFANEEAYLFQVSDEPIAEILSFEGYYLEGAKVYLTDGFLGAFATLNEPPHSADFLKWLNTENNDAMFIHAKQAIWAFYTFLSFKRQGITHTFTNNATRKQVATAVMAFITDNSVCYREAGPNPACELESVFLKPRYLSLWGQVYELLASLLDGGVEASLKTHENVFKTNHIFRVNIDYRPTKNPAVLKAMQGARQDQAKSNFLVTVRSFVSAQPTVAVTNEKDAYSKKLYPAIVERRKKAREAITEPNIKKLAETIDAASDMPALIADLVGVLRNDNDEVMRYLMYQFLIVSMNTIMENIKGNTAKPNQIKFLELMSNEVMTFMSVDLPKGLKPASTAGIRRYFEATLELHGAPNKSYYTTKIANEYRLFDVFIFVYSVAAEPDRKPIEKKLQDQGLVAANSTVSVRVKSDPFLLIKSDTFELFKNYVGLFKYFLWDRNLPGRQGSTQGPTSKEFLSLFNYIYKFLASLRFTSADVVTDPLASVWTACINCLEMRLAQPWPKSGNTVTEPCPLSYGEQMEVTYTLLGFYLNRNQMRFERFFEANETSPSRFPPSHIDRFLKLMYYESELSAAWEHFCLFGEDKDEAVFAKKPICVAVNIVMKTKNCEGLPGVRAAKGKTDELHGNAMKWLRTCINKELAWLKANPTNNQARGFAYSAFGALFSLDSSNGIFEVLLDEVRINGYLELKSKEFAAEVPGQKKTVKTGETTPSITAGLTKLREDYQTYIDFETAIAMVNPDDAGLKDNSEALKKQATELGTFLKLRFQRESFNSMEAQLAKDLFDLYNAMPDLVILDGNLFLKMVELVLKYATEDAIFTRIATLLIQSGKMLSVSHMNTSGRNAVEEAYFAELEVGTEADTKKLLKMAIRQAQMSTLSTSYRTVEKTNHGDKALTSDNFIAKSAEFYIQKGGEDPNGQLYLAEQENYKQKIKDSTYGSRRHFVVVKYKAVMDNAKGVVKPLDGDTKMDKLLHRNSDVILAKLNEFLGDAGISVELSSETFDEKVEDPRDMVKIESLVFDSMSLAKKKKLFSENCLKAGGLDDPLCVALKTLIERPNTNGEFDATDDEMIRMVSVRLFALGADGGDVDKNSVKPEVVFKEY